jgi:TonB family protein
MANGTGLPRWVWALLIVFALVFVLGIAAALVLPGLRRARIAGNESSAIGTVRMVISAQATAASVNGGFYLPLDCLADPSACIPGFTGPSFLGPLRGSGYSPVLVPGPAPTPEELQAVPAAAERSLKGFAFLMVPDQPGETGQRTFCVDQSFDVCYTEGTSLPDTSDGRCSACTPLDPASRRTSTPAPASRAPAAEPAPPPVPATATKPVAQAPAKATAGPLRVGGNIKPPTKIKDVRPAYPQEAVAARIQGVVVIEATIGPDGKVQDTKVLRSVPLLDEPALDAVRQWEYNPTLLNGAPVPVIMTVTVNFKLQ